MKSDCEVVHWWAVLVQLAPCIIEAACSLKWNIEPSPSLHMEGNARQGWVCVFSITDAIGLDMFHLLGLFCKPKFEPRDFLHINVSRIAVTHPSPFFLLNCKDNLKIGACYWAVWYILRKGEPPPWWNQPVPKRKVIGRKGRADEKIDSFPKRGMFFMKQASAEREFFFSTEKRLTAREGKVDKGPGE